MINYDLRPAKSTERKILIDLLRELCQKHSNEYRYAGMGSTYFTDFKLFHKELHIPKLFSFEKDRHIQKRVEYNKPFHCVNIIMKESTQALLDIEDWAEKYIFWMDYDDPLETFMFVDTDIIFRKLTKGSVFLMSCNQILRDSSDEDRPYSEESFRDKFGSIVPIDISRTDFASKSSSKTIRRLFLNSITDTLDNRNRELPKEQKLIFRPLFFFTYEDNAPMMTFGGYLDFAQNSFELKNFNLHLFEQFICQDDKPYRIEAPKITYKEYELLSKKVPNTLVRYLKDKETQFIPEREKKQFHELYKYLPNYMNVTS
jgi:hypothetical protein